MNKVTKKLLLESMIPLLRAKNAFVATEAARIICTVENCPVSEGIAAQQGQSSKANAQLTLARKQVAEKIQHKKEVRQRANRKSYLRKKLKKVGTESQLKHSIETELSRLDTPKPQDNPALPELGSDEPSLTDFNVVPITDAELSRYNNEAPRGKGIEECVTEWRKQEAMINQMMRHVGAK